MFLEVFKPTLLGVIQIFLLGAVGFFLVKKNFLNEEGLRALSRLVIEITLPFLIFSRLIREFSFTAYPDWWVYPLLSVAITVTGLIIGFLFMGFIKNSQAKLQFLSLVTFQNSGYLPLVLIAALLPKAKADALFIYLFLFLLGFNLIMWSWGVYLLTFTRAKKFELGSLFSPAVIATLVSLAVIYLGLNRFVPAVVLNPMRLVGDCTLPLALFVVGGNLAAMHWAKLDKNALFLLILAKLIVLPVLGFLLVIKFKFPELMGLLIILQLAMPPATSTSIIISHYKKEDLLISQGIFFGHIASLASIPVFLSLYFMISMIQ